MVKKIVKRCTVSEKKRVRNGAKAYKAKRKSRHLLNKYRSKFEAKVQEDLNNRKVPNTYESETIEYTQTRKYKPDFILENNGIKIIVEAKGLFDSEDRRKHLDVKKQHPDKDIRFVFYSDQRLYKGSKSRYSDWCTKNGFKFALRTIPEEWLKELGITTIKEEEESNDREKKE